MANLTAVIGADTSRFVEEVKSAQYMLNKFINETKNQSNTIKKNTQVTNEQIQSYQRVIKSLEKVGSGTMTAKQQQAALTTQIKELKIQWANLSDTAKNGDFGKSLASTLTEAQAKLKTITTQISQTNQEMTKLGNNTKNLGGINQIFGKFSGNLNVAAGAMSTLGMNGGQALSTVATKSSFIAGLGPALANPYVLAGAAITGAGVAWYKYNKEFEHTLRLTSEFTGLTGDALINLRNEIKSVADVWDKDYRDVLSTVDNLMVTYGIDGEKALQIIRDGFISGADDAGNLLSLIQQYSGSFKDAGISASELVAIIGNTRSGIFSEEGMQAIQMGAKNIRLMKDTTAEALNAIGISADEMTKKLADGSMTTIQAIQQIAEKLKELPPQSQEVGEVLQDVFGKQGAAAGTQLIEGLADIQTNLDEVKKQTGDYGQSLEDLADADKRLEDAMSETFGIADGGFETISNKAKTLFYEALILCVNEVNDFKESIQTWYAYTKAAIEQIAYSLNELAEAWESLANLDFDAVGNHLSNAFSTKKFDSEINTFYDDLYKKHQKTTNAINNNPVTPVVTPTNTGGNKGGGHKGGGHKGGGHKGGKSGGKSSKTTPKVEYKEGSLGFIEQELSKKQAELKLAVNDADRQKVQKEIDKLTGQKKAIELSLKPKLPEGSLDELNDKIKQKQVELSAAVDNESRKRIQKELDDLTKQKRDIEFILKPVVQKKDLDKLEEQISEHKISVNTNISSNFEKPQGKVEKAQSNAESLKTELDFNQQILKSYKEQYNAIQEKISLGGELTNDEKKLVSIYKDATNQVEELSDAYKDAAENASELSRKSQLKKKTWEGVKSGIGTLGDLNGAVMNVGGTWKGLAEQWEDMSPFEQVTSAFDATISTIESVICAYESINDMIKLFGEISELSSAKKIASNSAEMASDQTKMATETANTQTKLANDTAENTSEMGKLGVKEAGAIASATSSGASLPFPANIAAIAAGIAAVVAAFAMVFSCFADGGIVGNGSKIGDYNLARVNGGEMILNGTQQKRLFNLLNGTVGDFGSPIRSRSDVNFIIKGKALKGTLKNYDKRTNKI